MKRLFSLSNTTYDRLKWACLIFIPAVSVAYAALANTWGLPFGDKIPATLSIIEVFLGSLLGVSTAEYRKSNVFPIRLTNEPPESSEGGEVNGDN